MPAREKHQQTRDEREPAEIDDQGGNPVETPVEEMQRRLVFQEDDRSSDEEDEEAVNDEQMGDPRKAVASQRFLEHQITGDRSQPLTERRRRLCGAPGAVARGSASQQRHCRPAERSKANA